MAYEARRVTVVGTTHELTLGMELNQPHEDNTYGWSRVSPDPSPIGSR